MTRKRIHSVLFNVLTWRYLADEMSDGAIRGVMTIGNRYIVLGVIVAITAAVLAVLLNHMPINLVIGMFITACVICISGFWTRQVARYYLRERGIDNIAAVEPILLTKIIRENLRVIRQQRHSDQDFAKVGDAKPYLILAKHLMQLYVLMIIMGTALLTGGALILISKPVYIIYGIFVLTVGGLSCIVGMEEYLRIKRRLQNRSTDL